MSSFFSVQSFSNPCSCWITVWDICCLRKTCVIFLSTWCPCCVQTSSCCSPTCFLHRRLNMRISKCDIRQNTYMNSLYWFQHILHVTLCGFHPSFLLWLYSHLNSYKWSVLSSNECALSFTAHFIRWVTEMGYKATVFAPTCASIKHTKHISWSKSCVCVCKSRPSHNVHL